MMQLSGRTLWAAKAMRYTRQAIPIRGWERLFRACFHPEQQRDFRFMLGVLGGAVLADARSHLDRHALLYGSIEPDEVRAVRRTLAAIDARTCLDIGANVGHFSIAMADRCKIVHAFEPSPKVFTKLITNLVFNRPNIVAHNVGLSDRDDNLRFVSVRDDHDGQGNFAPNGDLMLPVVNGDSYLDRHGITAIDFIKIDVEGMEARVISGLQNTIATYRPVILCEASGQSLAGLPDYELWTAQCGRVLARKRFTPVNGSLDTQNVLCVPAEAMPRLRSSLFR